MVYFFDKERTHSRHATELLSCRSHCGELFNPLFYEINCCEGQGHEINQNLQLALTIISFVKKIIKVRWCLRSHVTTECSTKLNGPPQMFVYFTAFYDCDLTTLISLVLFPAEPSFLLHTKNGKTHMSCHSVFSEWIIFSLTQCHGIVNKIFSLSFFSDWNIPMSNL